MKILIFVVAYNAERHIVETLDRIDRSWLSTIDYEILIIDDASIDNTARLCKQYALANPDLKITIKSTERNLGYGGNQILGYQYAIEYNFDIVVLLHGDGQYAPEFLKAMATPILQGRAQLVLGSRMIEKMEALRGKMPFYKWIGNQVLTFVQNLLLNVRLAEFHTGYRAYSVEALNTTPFKFNSHYFDFDTEIIIQFIDQKYQIEEVKIPTFYGDEISYVNGFKYAFLIVWATLKSRFCKMGIIKDRRFDYDE